jgi:hypothetical protein
MIAVTPVKINPAFFAGGLLRDPAVQGCKRSFAPLRPDTGAVSMLLEELIIFQRGPGLEGPPH